MNKKSNEKGENLDRVHEGTDPRSPAIDEPGHGTTSAAELTEDGAARGTPTLPELGDAAREQLGEQLPEATINRIVAESHEIRHSMLKLSQEHLRMGGTFRHIMNVVCTHMVGKHGDNTRVRNEASDLAYGYIERVLGYSRSTVRLYIACYEKFIDHPDDLGTLPLNELARRLAGGRNQH